MTDSTESNDPDPNLFVADGFRVCDAASANWLVRKINEARAYARHVEQWAAAELRRAERQEAFFVTRYGQELETWTRSEIDQQHGKRKSLSLPAGTIGFRTEPMRFAVTDEELVRRWCRANLPAAIQTTERLLPSVVRTHAAATGEVPDGTDIRGGTERFYVK